MIYCIATTQSHEVAKKFPNVIKCINQMLLEEGCDVNPTPFLGKGYFGIDGDELEKHHSLQNGTGLHNKSKSIDLIFGMKTAAFQFIELKFRSNTFKWLNKQSFEEKVKGSTLALGNSTIISNTVFIVFSRNKIQQARHYLFRQHPVLNSRFRVVHVLELYQIFFS